MVCVFSQCLDSARLCVQDPVDKEFNVEQAMSWGRFQGDKQVGSVCYYCHMVHQGRYKHRGLSLAACIQTMGEDSKFHAEFANYRKVLVGFYIEKGTREVMVSWGDLDRWRPQHSMVDPFGGSQASSI